MSVYEGIQHVLHPGATENLAWSYAVLGFAMLISTPQSRL